MFPPVTFESTSTSGVIVSNPARNFPSSWLTPVLHYIHYVSVYKFHTAVFLRFSQFHIVYLGALVSVISLFDFDHCSSPPVCCLLSSSCLSTYLPAGHFHCIAVWNNCCAMQFTSREPSNELFSCAFGTLLLVLYWRLWFRRVLMSWFVPRIDTQMKQAITSSVNMFTLISLALLKAEPCSNHNGTMSSPWQQNIRPQDSQICSEDVDSFSGTVVLTVYMSPCALGFSIGFLQFSLLVQRHALRTDQSL